MADLQKAESVTSPGMSRQRWPTPSMARCVLGVPLLLGEIDDRDVGAFAREEEGDGAADARVAAGDERDFPLELAGRHVGATFVARARRDRRLDAGMRLVLFRVGKGRLFHDGGLLRARLLLFPFVLFVVRIGMALRR